MDESYFADAVAPAGEPFPVSGQPETGPVDVAPAGGDLKCFEWRTARYGGSWWPYEAAGRGCRRTV